MRCVVKLLMLAVLLTGAGLRADSANNYLNPPRTLPTPYGLKILRSSDVRLVQEESDLPVAGLSLGRYLDSIEDAELNDGAYSADLSEPLEDIGRAFQAQDQHSEAMSFFRRALHLSRINEGLYCANQLPALNGIIDSQMAMGRVSDADENQKYRYRVQSHVYEAGDQGFLDATMEYSEWQRTAYLDGLGDETYLRLLDIYEMHKGEIERIRNKGENDPALLLHLGWQIRAEYLLSQYEGEKQAEVQISISSGLDAQFAFNTSLEMVRFKKIKNNNFRNGRNALEEIVEMLAEREEPDLVALAEAKIALGDWYLWWDRLSRARQCYEEAYALLQNDSEPATDPRSLFAGNVELPEEPIFHPGAITLRSDRQARAVVLFNISLHGRVRDVQIVQMYPDETMGARIALLKMLKEFRFRPHVEDGKLAAVEAVVREYNFEY